MISRAQGVGGMLTEENKAIVRRSFEEFDRGNLASCVEPYARNAKIHFHGIPQPMNRDGFCQFLNMLRSAFPDLRHTVEDQVAEADMCVLRFTARGTNYGEFQGIAPTGRKVTIEGMVIDRIVDGLIVERWYNYDALGLMQQLGAISFALARPAAA